MRACPDDRLDDPEEACGVFGVYAPGLAVAYLTFDGLFALQHRGQESAGMAVSDGTRSWIDKDMGLVSHVFNDYKLAALQGHLAIGHTRYSTTGSSTWRNAQPVYRDTGDGGLRPRPQRQPHQHRELAADAGMLPGIGRQRQRPDRRAARRAMAPTSRRPTESTGRPRSTP